MDELFANVGKFLLEQGAGGIIALLALLALINERRERRADAKDYDAEIKAKDEAHIETLNRWRTDTQAQNDKMAQLSEKFVIAIEAHKRGS